MADLERRLRYTLPINNVALRGEDHEGVESHEAD